MNTNMLATVATLSDDALLEFHHVDPHACGGEATVDNISLRCRAHNDYESTLLFGPFDPSVVRETTAPFEIHFPTTCPGTGSGPVGWA